MACSEWQDQVLLYASGELAENEKVQFEEHCAGCESCRGELETRRHESATLFSVENLGEAPSPTVDAEILRLCANPKSRVVGTQFFPVVARRAVAALFFLCIGLGGGLYVAYQLDSGAPEQGMATQPSPAEEQVASGTGAEQAAAPASDSAADSTKRQQVFPGGRGAAAERGVVPVDLQK